MRKGTKFNKIIIVIFIIVIVGLLSIGGYGYYTLNKIKTISISKTNEDLGIKQEVLDKLDENKEMKKITNVLLLGVDVQENASDSIMVVSLDDLHNKLKLTSIMRDSYIDFGPDKISKINYAYHYGGPQLTIKTINENYNLDIRDYVKVDFGALAKIIDYMGGVEIDVSPEEVKILNKYVRDIAGRANKEPVLLKKSGLQTLNGDQAVGYCRIRYVGNLDYERTQRQRKVLTKLYEKVKGGGVADYYSIVTKLVSYVETSLDKAAILSMVNKSFSYGSSNIEQTRVPYDKYHEDAIIDGVYYLKWDKAANIDILHKFIYDDIKPGK